MRRLFTRSRKGVLAAAAGTTLALGGCDPTARDTVLAGVEGAATVLTDTFIRAFFETLQPEEEDQATIVQTFADDLPAVFS
jgi:hypothetical protein